MPIDGPTFIKEYSTFKVNLLTLPPNFILPAHRTVFKENGENKPVGAIYTHGYIQTLDEHGGPQIVPHMEWRPWHYWGWNNDRTVDDRPVSFQAGPDGAQWLCIRENGSGPVAVDCVTVDGSIIVPAGKRVIVVSSPITFDGITAAVGDVFSPRETDLPLSYDGVGKVLLVE